ETNNEQENKTAHIGEERNSVSECLQAQTMRRGHNSSCISFRCHRDRVHCGRLSDHRAVLAGRVSFRQHRHHSLLPLPLQVAAEELASTRQIQRQEPVPSTEIAVVSPGNSRMPAGSKCCGKDCATLRS